MIGVKVEDNVIPFQDETEKMNKLKEWKLISAKSKDIKQFYYDGFYNTESKAIECSIIGYMSKKTNKECINSVYETLVLKIGENTHKISIDCFREMQLKGKFEQVCLFV